MSNPFVNPLLEQLVKGNPALAETLTGDGVRRMNASRDRLVESVVRSTRGLTSVGLAEALHEEIQGHLAECGPDEEVGAAVAAFGQAFLVHIETIRARHPNLLVLAGRLDGSGEPATLCLHQSQLNVMLLKVKALKPDNPVRTIGFATE
jgi:hypothetical protein